ncbi:MAG TPA: hypothetical protein VLM79_18545 [Kofleriaceae bacterium]|nr:hypothetical protein [Kofleriaceae bacterium]
MRSWIATLALLAACGFSSSKTGDDDVDAGLLPDASPPDASTRFGTIVPVVLSMYPTATLVVDATDLDIDTGPTSQRCDPAVTQYCAVAATSFVVAAGRKIRARGLRPLVLVSLTTFDLSGDIDVSSVQDGTAGAGALPAADCMGVTPPPVLPTGNSGGFGGSFGGKGSDGDAVGGNRGAASMFTVSWPSPLRGGCPGSAGAGSGGFGGFVGGAVAIVADSISITGRINASGAGGRGGGVAKSGGGGGGSGGMIILDVPPSRITRNAAGVLFASGGGGGEGGTGGSMPATGRDGGNAVAPAVGALGGTSINDGGDGGLGSFGHVLNGGNTPGQGGGGDGGGGGGGGGAGIIYAPGITGDTLIAPPSPTITP